MSYEPTTWVTGDIITATKLNNIESGVQSVSSSYTPTTWATGDIITATKLNNIEQGIANAGGGSSDFSIAEVTVSVGDSPNVALTCAIADNYESEYYSNYNINIHNDTVVNVILYKGSAVAEITSAIGTITTSGSITELGEGAYVITGDCTITIS